MLKYNIFFYLTNPNRVKIKRVNSLFLPLLISKLINSFNVYAKKITRRYKASTPLVFEAIFTSIAIFVEFDTIKTVNINLIVEYSLNSILLFDK